MRMVDVRGPRSCCTAKETNRRTQAWDHRRRDTWRQPSRRSILKSGTARSPRSGRARGAGRLGTFFPAQVGSRDLRWARVRKVLSGPPHPGKPGTLWASERTSWPRSHHQERSSTHSQVRRGRLPPPPSLPHKWSWPPRPQEKSTRGHEPWGTGQGRVVSPVCGGSQGRCDNYHQQFKQTN